jgi:hypothetical protein
LVEALGVEARPAWSSSSTAPQREAWGRRWDGYDTRPPKLPGRYSQW